MIKWGEKRNGYRSLERRRDEIEKHINIQREGKLKKEVGEFKIKENSRKARENIDINMKYFK